MDAITVVRVAVTVVCMISFVAFVFLAFHKNNAAKLDAVAQSILDDDDSVPDSLVEQSSQQTR